MNATEWKTVPWEGRIKLPKDGLIDILAAMPGLLEEQDKIGFCPDAEREVRIQQLVQKCQSIDAELDDWATANKDSICEPEVEEPIPLTFPNLVTAHLAVLYWATCVILYEAVIDTNALLPMPPAFYLPPRQPDRRHPRPYAYRIARALSYFFRPSAGIWGATMIAFPLGVALQVFNRRDSEEDSAYKALVLRAWNNPSLPSAIKTFLTSMQGEAERRKAEGLLEKSLKAGQCTMWEF